MAATPQIIIYASLPSKVVCGTNLHIHPSQWEWVHCLSIPLNPDKRNTLQFSQRPFKWVRYAIGVVIGAEGDLYTSSDLCNIVDYNADLPVDSVTLYYHTSDEERQMMFPVDPHIFHTELASSVSHCVTSFQEIFHNEVAERDGGRCIWTGVSAMFCDAVHLVAHIKGDNYISTLTHFRGQGDENNIITEINNIRNGIFLTYDAHVIFGRELAFVKTPNFAMDTDDIDHTAPSGEKRLTAHLIQIDDKEQFPKYLISGSATRISDGPQFPPDILFDTIYAGFILFQFGTESVKDMITMKWEDTFYSTTATHASHNAITDEHATTVKRESDQAQKKIEHHDDHDHLDPIDMLTVLPYILVPANEQQEMMRAAREKVEEAEAAEQRNVKERVKGWIRRVKLNAIMG